MIGAGSLALCLLSISACSNSQPASRPVDGQTTVTARTTVQSNEGTNGAAGPTSSHAMATPLSALASPAPIQGTPGSVASPSPSPAQADKRRFGQAPLLSSQTWINSPPLTLEGLRGRVVVISFWTFACYNCQNTLPYFKAWDQKYRNQGLTIIGVHTPELSFERDVTNVKQAVKDDGIQYPIAIDGDYANWNRYHVQAWPTWFIVDKEGYIRYTHVGEGDYAGSERMILALLQE